MSTVANGFVDLPPSAAAILDVDDVYMLSTSSPTISQSPNSGAAACSRELKKRNWFNSNSRVATSLLSPESDLKGCFDLKVSVVMDSCSFGGTTNPAAQKIPECKLSQDMGILLKQSLLTDVVLSVSQHQQVSAHKAILAARSPVFSAMFSSNMEEQQKGRVEIPDIDFAVLKEMLNFIYTGTSPNIEKMAEPLLAAADKYDLQRLKMMCQDTLCANLTVENAATILMLADMHNAEELKTAAIDFLNFRPYEVMETDAFKTMSSRPNLITDAYKALVHLQSPASPPRKKVKFSSGSSSSSTSTSSTSCSHYQPSSTPN